MDDRVSRLRSAPARREVVRGLDDVSRRRAVAQVFAEIDWNGDGSVRRVTIEQVLGAL